MLYGLYRTATGIAGPGVSWLLRRREAQGKEDPERRGERFGVASLPRPKRVLVWIHAASVGEAQSALPVIIRLVRRGVAVLVTTGTVTSAKLMAERLPRGAMHQYAPLDRLPWVRAFLDHWKPDAALWTESELWPNMLMEVRARQIPAALLNARMSERSFDGWRRAQSLVRGMLDAFWIILPQTRAEAERFTRLGGRNVKDVGNLKYAADSLPADPLAFAALQSAVGQRPVWAMVSTHPGEEEIAAAIHERLQPTFPDLLTIIVPRHPDRGETIASLVQQRGLWSNRRSDGDLPRDTIPVHVFDTMGELGVVLRVTPVVCMGGSFVPVGGHNPIEPAQLGCAIVYGPHMFNFAEVAAELEEAGAAVRVASMDALTETVGRLIGAPNVRAFQSASARAVAQNNRMVLDRVMMAIDPVLLEAERRHAVAA